jgi:hypothetical protein
MLARDREARERRAHAGARPRTHPSRALWAALAVLGGAFAALALGAPPATNALVSRPSGFGALTTPITNDSSVDGTGLGIVHGSARTVSDVENGRFVAFPRTIGFTILALRR